MVYCVAWGCTTSSNNGNSHHFFRFPSEKTDLGRRKVWIHRCQRGEKNWKPSKYAVLCSDHFDADAYERDPFRLAHMGYEHPKARLKKDAVPTKFRTKSFVDGLPCVTRGAFRKRQTDEILRDILNDEQQTKTNPSKAFKGAMDEHDAFDKKEQDYLHEYDSMSTDGNETQIQYSELDESETDTDCDTDTETDHLLHMSSNPQNERQFLVSETSLAKLFQFCSHQSSSSSSAFCGMACQVKLMQQQGVMIIVETECLIGHNTRWNSQSMQGTMSWGNLLCASSILVSGGCAAQVLRMFRFMKMPIFNMDTFINIQRCYAVPSCLKVWNEHQSSLLANVGGKQLVLGGDGRCDSPGHCAKYGTYTLMDLRDRRILDIQLVQCNEVKNSHHMELEGLKPGLSFLKKKGCSIEEVITDRHVSVKKYMREDHKDKKHYFDVWHVSKGVGKKLEAAAKKSGCAAIRPWIKSTTNHMYWVAASCKDDPDMKVDKWLSVTNHVANKHEGHSTKFRQCEHGPLAEERLWLKEGSKPYKAFSSGYLVRDLSNLSPVYQTYALEVFHNVVNHFAPKNTHYFYAAMMARMFLAALHFNENGNRVQATDCEGNLRWKMVYPKSKKGEDAVGKPVKQPVTFNYAEDLRQAVIERRTALPNYTVARKDADKHFLSKPLPLTKSFKPFVKEELVSQLKSRFCIPK